MQNYQKPSESMNVSVNNTSVSKQTEDPDDSDKEDEWFDAKDDIDEDSIERSSDEIKDDNPFQVYKLNKEIGHIKKICPISNNDAWILADRKLYKMINQSLEDTLYADDADDIVVLNDGCVLILRKENTIIMKLLKNRRLVRFANVGSSSLLPYCFCNSIDDVLTVYLFQNLREMYEWYGFYKSCVVQMNKDGIVTGQFDLCTSSLEKPYLMQYVKSALCVIYLKDSERCLYCIKILKKYGNGYVMAECFDGIIGYDPTKNFECHGICTNNYNIFVSDIRHHSVYALDKKIKYIKCLADARDGLDKPTAVAIYSDYLWIADGEQIFILDLNHTNYDELHLSRYSTLDKTWKWLKNLISNLFGIGE